MSAIQHAEAGVELDALERRLIDHYQRGFPVSPTPYADIALALDTSEEAVLAALDRLKENGALSRVGAVIAPHTAGWSTLAAMVVPAARLDEVARMVSSYPAINHNYEREHATNLWFVATGPDEATVRSVLAEIEDRAGIAVIALPLVETYHIDLGFALS